MIAKLARCHVFSGAGTTRNLAQAIASATPRIMDLYLRPLGKQVPLAGGARPRAAFLSTNGMVRDAKAASRILLAKAASRC